MNYIIRREGPGLTPERLDELEAARPMLLRQEPTEPGVYTWLERDHGAIPPLTAEEHEAESEACLARARNWDTTREKAIRAKDETLAAHAMKAADEARKKGAAHAVAAMKLVDPAKGQKEGRK